MAYPYLAENTAAKVAATRVRTSDGASVRALNDLRADFRSQEELKGTGPSIDLLPFEWATEEIGKLFHADSDHKGIDQDAVEGQAAGLLHRAVIRSEADVDALDDPGFWRWVGLACTWNFAAWREHGAFSVDVPGEPLSKRIASYIDGNSRAECVALRMYLRVRCLGGSEHTHLASAVKDGTDFWRSHILRVTQGEHPPVVRAMVRLQAEESTRLKTAAVRAFAKDLNRTLVNLTPAMLDDEAATQLVEELWLEQL